MFLVRESNDLPLPFVLPIVVVRPVHVWSGLLAHLHYPTWTENKNKVNGEKYALYFNFIANNVVKAKIEMNGILLVLKSVKH